MSSVSISRPRQPARRTSVSLGPATVPYTTAQGAAVLIGNKERIKEIIDSLFTDAGSAAQAKETATPEPVRVQVQNGTGTEGLATRIVAYIVGKGYPADDLNAANVFDGQSHSVSAILDVTGTHRQNAYLIAKWLSIPPAQVRDASASERTAMSGNPAEIVVVLGSDVDYGRLIESPTTSTPGG